MVQLEGHKLMYHPDRVSDWIKGTPIAPIYIEIGLTSRCNHRCIFCALDYVESKNDEIDPFVIKSALKSMSKVGVKSVMFCGEGEPTLHKDFSSIVNFAKKSGLDIALTTNGVFFNEKNIKQCLHSMSWVKFSIDAGTPETYSKVHRCKEGDFEKVINNVAFAAKFKKENKLNTTIGTQMLILPDNYDSIESLIIKVKKAGADYLVLKPYSQHPHSKNKMLTNLDAYKRHKIIKLMNKYSSDTFEVIFREQSAKEVLQEKVSYKECHGLDFATLIDAQGYIMPCNLYHEMKKFYYGNLYNESFESIWFGKQRKKIVQNIRAAGCKDCRRGCRLNYANQFLDKVKKMDVESINFI